MNGRQLTGKHKLNSAYINGALIVVAIVELAFKSWTVFLIVAGVLMATSLHDRSIRR